MTDYCDACPFKGCDGCRYQGGAVVAHADWRVSAGQAARIGAATTNGPGLQPETVLSHPIDRTEGMT